MPEENQTIISIISFILIFSFISVIYLTVAILNFAIINDYMIYELQNITEDLENKGVVISGLGNQTQIWGDKFTNFNFHYDDLWFLAYALLVISSLVAAYKTKPQNYFGFLSLLFYGIMFILFILTLYVTITEWFKNEILLALIPEAIIVLPKFYFYLDHVGIFSAVHIVLCLIVNLMDFDFIKSRLRSRQEKDIPEDKEII